MADRRELVRDHVALGLAITALGCAPPGIDVPLDDEAGPGDDDSDGDGDSDGDSDSDGDGEPNDIPFELVSAAMDATGKYVALRFSEPVAPVDGVDPRDFRISFAFYSPICGGYDCIYQTVYSDPNFYAGYYLGYQPDPSGRFETDLIAPGNQPTDIFLRFEMPLDPSLCEFTGYYGEYHILFVHHSPGGIPLRSSDGETLEAIGSHWVEQPELKTYVPGNFSSLDPKISIPCSL